MSNKKIKDLNDAKIHLKGDFLKLALGKAKPMRVIEEEEHVKSSGRDGWLKLRDIVKYCLAHKSDTEDCVSYIQSFTSKVCDMAAAYLEYEDEMDVEFLRLRSLNGLDKVTDIFKRTIRKEARIQKADQRRKNILQSIKGGHWGEKPNDFTWQKLQKKTATIGGETIEIGIKNTLLNLETIFRTDPKWSSRISWSTLHCQTMVDGELVDDILLTKIQSWLAKAYGVEYKDVKTINKYLNFIAQDNKFHPVQEWLDGLRWDGEYRLHKMAKEIFRSKDASSLNFVGDVKEYKKFGIEGMATLPQIAIIRSFISAVARASDPGCKVDWMPILISKQGYGKSQSIKNLAFNPKWFANVSFDVRKKDAITNVMGKWLCEYPEVETLSKAGHSAVKQFLSSSVDRVELKYAIYSCDIPRTCVFWGSTNLNELELLNDTTGSRRFVAFRVGKINATPLYDPEFVSQLWAEAVFYYANKGEKWWFDGKEAAARDRLNRKFRQVDIWEERIDNIIAIRGALWVQIKRGKITPSEDVIRKADRQITFTVQDIVEEFGLDLDRLTAREKRRIESAIRHLGCDVFGSKVSGGGRVTTYRPNEEYLQSLTNFDLLLEDGVDLDRQEF
tara:strand:+ start:4647 stop:6491 length:1845 start_codon:yes stop_codon:yes gene_type:complete